MPKPTKLHAKGKPKTIQKPITVEKDTTKAAESEDSLSQFQLELCWCIQQLERTLSDKKVNEKQLQDAWKVLQVLKNNNQPMIRKRQLMRTHFGDYRAKMAAEEKKLAKMASKMKITDSPAQPKATFYRKSAFLTTGDSSFCFNFDAPEQIDNGSAVDKPTTSGNTENIAGDGTTIMSNSGDGNKQNSAASDITKKFKFSFTNTAFKFNFDVDN